METTCHSGSTGLSLLPWPCPGHINPSDRIARTCPSFWVSIYTTWQSLWPSLTQCSKKERKKKEDYFGMVGCLEETEFFHLFALLSHTFTVLKRKCCSMSTTSWLNFKISGERNAINWYCLHGLISSQRTLQFKPSCRKRKTWRIWWERTLTWKVLECWPLSLTPPNMFPQAIP